MTNGITTDIGVMFVTLNVDKTKQGIVLFTKASGASPRCIGAYGVTIYATNTSGTIALNFGDDYTNKTGYSGIMFWV